MDKPEDRQPPEVLTSDTDNATKIHPKEAPPHQRAKFKRFRAYNTGTWNGPKRENKEVTLRQDNLHRFDAISSSLGLTDYQKTRSRSLFDDIKLTKTGYSVDEVAFAVCVAVANADVDDGTRYWPNPDTKDNDKAFEEISEEIGLRWRLESSLIQKMQSKMAD